MKKSRWFKAIIISMPLIITGIIGLVLDLTLTGFSDRHWVISTTCWLCLWVGEMIFIPSMVMFIADRETREWYKCLEEILSKHKKIY